MAASLITPREQKALDANRKAIKTALEDAVPISEILTTLPIPVGFGTFRVWVRQQSGIDWGLRDRMRRRKIAAKKQTAVKAIVEFQSTVESPAQAEAFAKLMNGRHYGHLHARRFIPDRRYCLPPTYIPSMSAAASCERHALTMSDWSETIRAANQAGAPKDKGERAQDYQHRFWRTRKPRAAPGQCRTP